MSRWNRYWFDEGGRTAAAVVRIAIAVGVLLSLQRLGTLSVLVAPAELYRPVGPWMLLGGLRPPDALIDVMWIVAWVSSIAMLLGVATRASTAISFATAMPLAAISFSGNATWSHQYNVVFLAQLAFLGARGGDTLSIDAWLRHRRGLPPVDEPRGYQWSLRLVQLAVALMFAGAAFYKLAQGGPLLRWAFSDNLRHQLLLRYDLAGLERPAIVDWLLAEAWRYQTTAALNLVSQLMPLVAVIFTRRPLVRAVAAGFFLVEVIALDVVVSLWNPAWLPLAAVFIDWDRLLRRPAPPPAPPTFTPPRARRIFILVFFIYELLTAFIPTLDQKLNTFPFSGFPMFSTMRVQKPYDEHRPFSIAADHIMSLEHTVHVPAQRWLDGHHRGIFKERSQDRIRGKLALILSKAPSRYPDLTITGLRHYLAIFEVPAYPGPAKFNRTLVGITGELRPDGVFRSLLGSLRGTTLTLKPTNLDASAATFAYYRDDVPTAIPITPVRREGNTVELPPLPGSPVYVVATVDGLPWLVASRK